MRRQAKTYCRRSTSRRGACITAILATFLILALSATGASASKQAIAYFGTEVGMGSLGGQFEFAGDIAVNGTGAGPANQGDIYVADKGNRRIQRFAQNNGGTPENPYDDAYEFVSAWGADVDGATVGGSDYEICTVAANCKAGLESGGNGTVSGNGALGYVEGIAVDGDTGEVYVSEYAGHRIAVYSGDGTFLRAMGFDVVESGPDDAGSGYEICIGANGDVCKVGLGGSGAGQVEEGAGIAVTPADGNPGVGTVYLGDRGNRRVNTYELDGSSPSSFGSATNFGIGSPARGLAVDSRGIVYVEATSGGLPASQTIVRYDSQNANGGGVGFLAPISIPPLLTEQGSQVDAGLEVDPDSDGAGPDSDVLYALRGLANGSFSVVQQFGPINPPGLAVPPGSVDDTHGSTAKFNGSAGLGLDGSDKRLFVSSSREVNGEPDKSGVYALDEAGGSPIAGLDSFSDPTSTSVTVNGTINPDGPPDVTYRLEYSLDGINWVTDTNSVALLGSQESPQPISPVLRPPGGGLQPNTFYHVRLLASKVFTPPAISAELTFTTPPEAPRVETVGSPVRTTATAQLNGRVNPRNQDATYYFEYGEQGPCDSNPCTASEPQPAGAGGLIELVSQQVEGLTPSTTYHYRVVADNGAAGSPSAGEDMTFTTRASDQPLSHGHLPGPVGSDRAWEQVSPGDASGNPVGFGVGFSDNGERALFSIFGGTSLSSTGSLFSLYFAERGPSGWQTRDILPSRDEQVGANWSAFLGPHDLSVLGAVNENESGETGVGWRFNLGGAAEKLVEASPPRALQGFSIAERSSRVAGVLLGGSLDPAYPAATATPNAYDVGAGTPQLPQPHAGRDNRDLRDLREWSVFLWKPSNTPSQRRWLSLSISEQRRRLQ